MKVVACYGIKGGVGKTSAAVNLAYLWAKSGRRTLLWDLDPQAAATFLFRVKPRVKGGAKGLVKANNPLDAHLKATDFENLDLLPADFSYRNLDLALGSTAKPTRRLRRLLRPLATRYDMVVLDCPPSVSLVSENVLEAADVVAVPLVPSTLSLRTFDQLASFAEFRGRGSGQLVGFLSMVDRRRSMHRKLAEELPGEHPNILSAYIPASSLVERMGEERAPVVTWAPRSAPARSYRALWAALENLLQSGAGPSPKED